MGTDRSPTAEVHIFGCSQCPRLSSAFATGWKAYRIDDLEEEPELAFFCPDCSRREFGKS